MEIGFILFVSVIILVAGGICAFYLTNDSTCKHENVDVLYSNSVTSEPKEGRCKDCGQYLYATTIWTKENY